MRYFTGSALVLFLQATFACATQTVLQAARASTENDSRSHVASESKRILTEELQAFVQSITDRYGVQGLTLGVVHSGETELGAWGRKTEDGEPMIIDTMFYLASCSKAFLSASMGILIDDFAHGRNSTPLPPGVAPLDWYTKVKDILPAEWQLMDEDATQHATIRDVLSHQSGLPRHELSYQATDGPLDVILRMRHLRPAFELRQRYHYNNQMYMLGAYVISKYSGMTYMDFVKQRVWQPLNMSTTTFSQNEANADGKLSQVWSQRGRRIPVWMSDDLIALNAGPGGVISSVVDMVEWVKLLLNAGAHPGTNNTIIPKSAFDMVTTGQIVAIGRGEYPEFSIDAYGMGWHRFSYQGHEVVTHSGGIPGISTNVFFLPDDDLGIVTLANTDATHVHEFAIIYRIIEDYLDLKRVHSSRILKMLDEEGQKAGAITLGAELRVSVTSSPEATSPSPPSLPLVAYAGTYADPGYPTLTLCSSQSNSVECQSALEQFAHFENITTANTLYVHFPSLWLSHARMIHRDGNTFALAGTVLFPHGYGKDTSAFELGEVGAGLVTIEFVVEESEAGVPEVIGMGLRRLVGETTNRERSGGSVEEVAEVYFRKV